MHEIVAVNCAGMNAQQKAKIRRAASASPQINLYFSDVPAYQHEYDLCIIAEKLLQSDSELLNRLDYCCLPVIVFGRKASFPIAAASACSDAVHEDCTGSELLYRIMKQRRRNYISIADRTVMIHPKFISCEDRHISISGRERKLLQIFSFFPPETVLTREYLSMSLGIAHRKHSRVLDMHISNLRKKIARAVSNIDPGTVIQAVPREGYAIAHPSKVRGKNAERPHTAL